jgi:hypothetical protein
VKVVKPYVDQIEAPRLSGIYHVDEMMVHVRKEKTEKGHYQWLWNLMDNTTRFWICTRISQKREVADARAVFQEAKKVAPQQKPIALCMTVCHHTMKHIRRNFTPAEIQEQ